MSVENEIRRYINIHFAPDIPPEDIPLTYDLVATGILNSLALVRLIAWLGSTYGIPINELELSPDEFRTIECINNFVTNNSAHAASDTPQRPWVITLGETQ